ncbi:hypothetical protein KDA23_05850 [Candidatus Saccharibacteria bacterium]|nr:hypothetical protein [Candidatus Saccharibacteria bacterium]
MSDNIDALDTFTIDALPSLDVVVLGALELFSKTTLPRLDLSIYKHPLIVGSGNAEATGKILFESADAMFASESNFEEKLAGNSHIDGVVLISASGGKHAPIIAKRSRELDRHVTLITNTPNSLASAELDHEHDYDEYVFPKNREPYTYNTSTYMGMILGATGEDPTQIQQFIEESVSTIQFPDFNQYDKYYLIVPAKYSGIIRMLQVKFIELFGRNIARDVETDEYVAHATTVAPSNELFISFGKPNETWGQPENRLHIPLSDNAGHAEMMAVGYFVIAQIQKAYPHFFKDNIADYCKMVSEIFGSEISPIVDK